MIELLKNNHNGTYDVVSDEPIKIGMSFSSGVNAAGIPIIVGRINAIVEQRKERGQYKDKSLRRNWARVE